MYTDMNGFVGRGTIPELGGNGSVMQCSCITTDLGPHRAQMNIDICVDIDLLWYTYKAYMVILSTSLTSIYMYSC